MQWLHDSISNVNVWFIKRILTPFLAILGTSNYHLAGIIKIVLIFYENIVEKVWYYSKDIENVAMCDMTLFVFLAPWSTF